MGLKIVCPKCGSDQITANKHGFSAGKAVAGAVLTGGIGLLAGMHGSKKVDITCLACGKTFHAGEGRQIYVEDNNDVQNIQVSQRVIPSDDELYDKYKEIGRKYPGKPLAAMDEIVMFHMKSTGLDKESSNKDVIRILDEGNVKRGLQTSSSSISGCLVMIGLIISGVAALWLF